MFNELKLYVKKKLSYCVAPSITIKTLCYQKFDK